MYFLVHEKLERERVYGPGHFASSQTSLLRKIDGSAPPPSTMKPLLASASTKMNGRSPQPSQSDQAPPGHVPEADSVVRKGRPCVSRWARSRTHAARDRGRVHTPHPSAPSPGVETNRHRPCLFASRPDPDASH
ncbi:hypothetical protein DFH11DRAFT_1600596, partial [Phellopilus nigrolimitatus]